MALLVRSAEAGQVARQAVAVADREGRLDDLVQPSIIAGRVAEDSHDFERAFTAILKAFGVATGLSTVTSALAAGAGALRVVRGWEATRIK
jgi:hypothetical protein